jgi:hypothetical protein
MEALLILKLHQGSIKALLRSFSGFVKAQSMLYRRMSLDWPQMLLRHNATGIGGGQ